jgi:hypothetical protein
VREESALDDPAGLYLVETAARAWDRAQEARRAIEKDGLCGMGAQTWPAAASLREAPSALTA